jgi:hypothetical protein
MSLDIRPNPAVTGSVTGSLVYKGSYNATTSSPSLVSAEKGDFYIVSVAGSLAGVTLNVGDHIVFNQNAANPVTSAMFDVIDNTDAVASVNGQTGVVSLGASDVSALAIASNLSDLNNAGTARTNLGLGTSSTLDVGTGASEIVQLTGASKLPAVDGSLLTNVTSTDATKLAIASNLSDLNNAGTARTNLGLGTSSTLDVGTGASEIVQLTGASKLPAVDGSLLTNVTGTDATKLAIASNLSDLNNVGTARTNLGLGTAATKDTGTSNGDVVLLDATGLPAVDGSQLTGVTGTDATKLAIASNLSDLNNVGTARTNLGLGTSATIDVGTGASEIVQLTGASKLPAVDGSLLTNVTSTDSTKLAIASNLSDLNNVGTARTNLGLGTSATIDVGTGASEVVQLTGASKLPAVDGSLLTNVTGTDATKLAIASNLSDLNNAGTARTNLGLGTAATKDTGTSNGDVVLLDATGLPAVDGSQLTGVTGTDATKLAIASNLSDLNNVGTARTNLGLGTSAIIDVGTGASEVVQLTGASKLPAVDGSLLTNVTSTDTTKLAIASNLSDLNNVGTARTNLGLGTAATKDTGTSNGDVVLLDATGLPAVDGSQLTGVTGTDATKLAITNNLSDLNNAGTARTNLGLGTSAIIDVGTGASEVVQLTAASKLPAVDGSLLTNVTSTDTTKLAITNNLSDLNNAGTARTNLGLGSSSTLDVGTGANEVVQLTGASKLPAVDGSLLTNLPSSGSRPTVTSITAASYTIGTTDSAIGASELERVYTCSSSAATVNLPASSGLTGFKLQVKNLLSSTITIDPDGTEQIDSSGAGTAITLTVQYESVTLLSDGTGWLII